MEKNLQLFEDNRGTFFELFTSKDFEIKQVSSSVSKKGVMRGIHVSPYEKVVTCITGSIFDVMVDLREESENYGKYFSQIIDSKQPIMVRIPANCGHAFLSLEDNSTVIYAQNGSYNKNLEKEFNCLSPDLNINWPVMNYIISDKDKDSPVFKLNKYDYLLFGDGFLGTELIKVLEEQKKPSTVSKVRLEDYISLEKEIQKYKPKYIISSAGISGNPNIDWCEDNKEETIMVNIVGQLNLAKIAHDNKIHLTIFTSGVIYEDFESKGMIFSEHIEPNYSKNFYSFCRIHLEKLMKFFHVLMLRISYPITDEKNPKSLISKLLTYNAVNVKPMSISFIPDLFQYIPNMCEKRLIGIYNFVNPGFISNDKILQLYKNIVNPNHNWEIMATSNRAQPMLDTTKLTSLFPVQEIEKLIFGLFRQISNIKPSVLIFGANGMLGRYITNYFEKKNIFCVVKSERKVFDIEKDINNLGDYIFKISPKYIINCAGIINKRPDISVEQMYAVNSEFPKELDRLCSKSGIQLVHISTDCIYSGRKGISYTHDDNPDSLDDYGISKCLGENLNACVIRTSIIGEDPNQRSLMSWLFENKGKTVNGFKNHIWNGVTCLELAKLIHYLIINDRLWLGIKNVVSESVIDKYTLIQIISKIYNLDLNIQEDFSTSCNRSLKADVLSKSITQQIQELKEWKF